MVFSLRAMLDKSLSSNNRSRIVFRTVYSKCDPARKFPSKAQASDHRKRHIRQQCARARSSPLDLSVRPVGVDVACGPAVQQIQITTRALV